MPAADRQVKLVPCIDQNQVDAIPFIGAADTKVHDKLTMHKTQWRAATRVAAAFVNTAMCLYVYAVHLLQIDWRRFGHLRTLEEGQSPNVFDYFVSGDLETAFDMLRIFTFSDAILQNLDLYMMVGTPVAIALFTLEKDRVRWLQSLFREALPEETAAEVVQQLQIYFYCISVTLVLILLIGPLHLDRPIPHYLCAGAAMSAGCTSITLYLTIPTDLPASGGEGKRSDAWRELMAWSKHTKNTVRPILKIALFCHVAVVVVGGLKASSLGDDYRALAFGIVETAVVIAYQAFQMAFVYEDFLIDAKATKPTATPSATLLIDTVKTPMSSMKNVGEENSFSAKLEVDSHQVPQTLIGS
eukprot:TRINITY_DN21209_c0_g1_i1.p1 TRINITY_DN21209_c0_g1~~TRINITY_DN21209_c0_g1_i1.p1  ORF type:complete len:357 (-),score=65.68 TRINITY_DN21209_c0_g1_i1:167-1237(-)